MTRQPAIPISFPSEWPTIAIHLDLDLLISLLIVVLISIVINKWIIRCLRHKRAARSESLCFSINLSAQYRYRLESCTPLVACSPHLEKISRLLPSGIKTAYFELHHRTLTVYGIVAGSPHKGVGYAWNGASGPAIDTANTLRGSMFHDVLYQICRRQPMSIRALARMKWHADLLLIDLLKEDQMIILRRWCWWLGLFLGGWLAAWPRRHDRFAQKHT